MSPFAWERWVSFFQDFSLFTEGFLYTLGVSFGALTLAVCLGVFFGLLSNSEIRFFRVLTSFYVSFYQNTPLLVQFVVVFYGFPLLDSRFTLSDFSTAVICVGLYHGAYISEVVRSGIEAVSTGQMEAAMSQGLSHSESMRMIILPQSVRMILPPFTNQVVNLIKNTSTVAIISGADIMFTAKSWSAGNLSYIPAFVGAAALYFIICFPLTSLARYLEEKNKRVYDI